jgi:DNA polymerase-3 subunit epsilon
MTTSPAPAPLPYAASRRYPHRYAVLDVETTGLDPRRHRVLQIAITQLDAHGEQEQRWATLVQPGGIDLGPVDVHGITAERLAGAPSYGEVAEVIDALLDDRVVVAHNAGFDWAFLAAEHRRLGRLLPTRQRLCTLELSRRLRTPAATFSLESLSAYWQVPQARPHDAEDDVRVLVEVLRHALDAAAEAGLALPIRDPYAPVPWRTTWRRKVRRRWRRLRWKVRRAVRGRVTMSDTRVR